MYSPLRRQRAKAEMHSPRLPARSRFGEGRAQKNAHREATEHAINSVLSVCAQ